MTQFSMLFVDDDDDTRGRFNIFFNFFFYLFSMIFTYTAPVSYVLKDCPADHRRRWIPITSHRPQVVHTIRTINVSKCTSNRKKILKTIYDQPPPTSLECPRTLGTTGTRANYPLVELRESTGDVFPHVPPPVLDNNNDDRNDNAFAIKMCFKF